MHILPLKDISTPILLGYALYLSKYSPKNDEDLQYRKDLQTELKSRGVMHGFETLITGPTN